MTAQTQARIITTFCLVLASWLCHLEPPKQISILQRHDQVLKVGTSTNKGDNQYFVQINKN